MKKVLLVGLLLCTACDRALTVDGKTYGSYGLFNESTDKNEKIEYQVCKGNVIWSVVGFETAVIPLVLVGFSLYEPIGLKDAPREKGVK